MGEKRGRDQTQNKKREEKSHLVRQERAFPGGAKVKNSPASAGDLRGLGSIPGSGRCPGGGHGNPLQHSCLENPMDRGSQADYSPWGHKESDKTDAAQHTGKKGKEKMPAMTLCLGFLL